MTKMTDAEVQTYAQRMQPLLKDAQRAYGARDIESPQHDASRELTALLVDYYERGGSLAVMGSKLGVTYAALRRRVRNSALPPLHGTTRAKHDDSAYAAAVQELDGHRLHSSSEMYHLRITHYYERGFSLNRIAREMGLSSANPAYHAVNAVRLKRLQNP